MFQSTSRMFEHDVSHRFDPCRGHHFRAGLDDPYGSHPARKIL